MIATAALWAAVAVAYRNSPADAEVSVSPAALVASAFVDAFAYICAAAVMLR